MGYSDESNDELYEYDLPVSDSASESPSMTSIGSTSNHIASMLALKLKYEAELAGIVAKLSTLPARFVNKASRKNLTDEEVAERTRKSELLYRKRRVLLKKVDSLTDSIQAFDRCIKAQERDDLNVILDAKRELNNFNVKVIEEVKQKNEELTVEWVDAEDRVSAMESEMSVLMRKNREMAEQNLKLTEQVNSLIAKNNDTLTRMPTPISVFPSQLPIVSSRIRSSYY